jgi:hypothetical protein
MKLLLWIQAYIVSNAVVGHLSTYIPGWLSLFCSSFWFVFTCMHYWHLQKLVGDVFNILTFC